MDLKSGLIRAGLWLTLVIGVFGIGSVLLIVSNKRVPSGSTGVSRDIPGQAAAVKWSGGQFIQDADNTAELKEENDSAPMTETLFSKTDKPTEMAATSPSPLGFAREEQEEGQGNKADSGEGNSFRDRKSVV